MSTIPEQEYIHIRQYDVVIRKHNKELYDKFDGQLYGSFKTFPKKPVQDILMDLLKKEVISFGLGSKDYDDYGNIVFKPTRELVGIVLNTNTNDIELTTGNTSNPFDITIIAYYLYIKALVVANYEKISKDGDFIENCVKYLKYLFYKVLKMSGLTDDQQKYVDGLIEVFFYKFIMQEPTVKAINNIKDETSKKFLKEQKDLIDRYSKFTEIFRAFYDLKIIVNENPTQMLMRFVNSIGVVQLSLLATHGLNGFVAAMIASQYSSSKFKGLYIDPKLQGYIEEKVIKFHANQKFTEYDIK